MNLEIISQNKQNLLLKMKMVMMMKVMMVLTHCLLSHSVL